MTGPDGACLHGVIFDVSERNELREARVHAHARLPPAVEIAAYHVVSESLTNMARHAQATRGRVRLACADDALVVEVTAPRLRGAGARPFRGKEIGRSGRASAGRVGR